MDGHGHMSSPLKGCMDCMPSLDECVRERLLDTTNRSARSAWNPELHRLAITNAEGKSDKWLQSLGLRLSNTPPAARCGQSNFTGASTNATKELRRPATDGR